MTPPPPNDDTTRSDLGARPPALDAALEADRLRRAEALEKRRDAAAADDRDGSRTRRLVLLQLVGRGGFGEVYAGRLETPGGLTRRVAVKLLREDIIDEQTIGRTTDEAHLLARLSHPTVVAIEDLVTVQGRLAIISEYVDGVDVSEVIPLPPLAALEVFTRVAEALHAAWSSTGPDGLPLRIVHRDIKPSNIRVGPNGVVKLLDFGIARSHSAPRRVKTGSGLLVGSIGYVAPERWLGKREEHPSDIYALGCVLAESITGQGVFSGVAPVRQMAIANNPDTHAAWIDQQLEPLSRIAPSTAGLARQMLAWDPDDRPSAVQFTRLARQAAAELEGEGLLAWSGTLNLGAGADWSTADGTVLAETNEGFSVDGVPITAELETIQRARSVGGVDSLTTRLVPAPAATPGPDRGAVQGPSNANAVRRTRRSIGAAVAGGGAFVLILALGLFALLGVAGLGAWGWSEGWFDRVPGELVSQIDEDGGPGLSGESGQARSFDPGADGELDGLPSAASEEPAADPATVSPEPEPVPSPPKPTAPSRAASTRDSGTSAPVRATLGESPAKVEAAVVIHEVPVHKPPPVAAAPAAEATPTGRVVVNGRAQVRLRGPQGPLPVGQVPVGTYKVEAAFSDAVFREFGRITVVEGGTRTIQCDARFRKCEAQ